MRRPSSWRPRCRDGSTALLMDPLELLERLVPAAPALARVSRAPRPTGRMALDDRPAARAGRRARGRRRACSKTVAVGPAPPPRVRDRNPGVRPLRGPAADPRRGDQTPCGAAGLGRARPGRRAAARPTRPCGLTPALDHAQPPTPRSPCACRPAGAAFRAPPLRAPAALAGPASDALSFGRSRWRRGRCWTRGQRRERGHRARRRGHGTVARTSYILGHERYCPTGNRSRATSRGSYPGPARGREAQARARTRPGSPGCIWVANTREFTVSAARPTLRPVLRSRPVARG